jgi:hypothetical protein
MPELRLTRRTAAVTLAAFLAFPACMRAGTDALRPGEYITENGWGVLTISASKDRTAHFSIEAIGGNGHMCSLEGEVRDLRALLDVDDPGRSCVVTFLPKAESIEVSSVDSETCRFFCGMRASFEGQYFKPGPGCSDKERSATHEQFKQLYDAKSYAKASAVLEPLLGSCSKLLNWLESGWTRNDLAITQYHLGRLEDCRKTLEPLITNAAKTEEELRDSLPPSDFDNYLPIAKATWHNSKLCAEKKR